MTWCSPRMRIDTAALAVAGARVKTFPPPWCGCPRRAPTRSGVQPEPRRRGRRSCPAIARDPVVVRVEHRDGRCRQLGDHLRLGPLRGCSMPPKSPAWARPTLSTTRDVGTDDRRRAGRYRRCALAPISTTRKRVSSSTASIEIGAPTWLLNEPRGATVGPDALEQTPRSRFFVVVLPFEPVMPTTEGASGADPGDHGAREGASAATPSATMICGTSTSTGVRRRRARRPPAAASAANRWPSVELARQGEEDRSPRATSRESVVHCAGHHRSPRQLRAVAEQRAVDRRGDLGQAESDHGAPAGLAQRGAGQSLWRSTGCARPAMSR